MASRMRSLRPIAQSLRTVTPRCQRFAALAPATTTLTPSLHRNTFHSSSIMSGNDEYSKKTETERPLGEKLGDLRAFLKKHHTVLFTTHAPDGGLHARVMAPAEITPDWKFRFLYDTDSYKDAEVENDYHVNLAQDGSADNSGWVSIAGKAKRITEEGLVAKLYNPTIKAWFGDKGDGVHNGEPSDPRIAVLEVKVDEIRHFHQQRTSIGTVVDVVASAISGATATPGEIRTITGQEIASAWAAGNLKEP